MDFFSLALAGDFFRQQARTLDLSCDLLNDQSKEKRFEPPSDG
jgi:hypothetical protein